MRLLPFVVLALLGCTDLVAQSPKEAPKAAAQSPAADRWKALGDKQAERQKAVPRGDTKARSEVLAARAADLTAFLGEFPKSTEANKARVEIAQIATMNKDDKALAEAADKALASFDASQSDLRTTMMAANIAGMLGLADRKAHLVDQAEQRATSIDDKMDLVMNLKLGMKDTERADKLLAATEAAAKTDEDKASIAMGKANLVRRADSKNKEAYAAALAEVVKTYPNTKAGKLASSKVAAANLKAGSDPVAFTAKDLDGKSVSPADYKGKVLLIDFWATWCGPCMAELPNVLKAYEQYHEKGFEILGVSLDREGDLAKLQSVMADKKMTWRQIYDGKYWNAEIAVLHDVQAIPFTILIGKDGKVVGTNLRGEKLAEAVGQALEAK